VKRANDDGGGCPDIGVTHNIAYSKRCEFVAATRRNHTDSAIPALLIGRWNGKKEAGRSRQPVIK